MYLMYFLSNMTPPGFVDIKPLSTFTPCSLCLKSLMCNVLFTFLNDFFVQNVIQVNS